LFPQCSGRGASGGKSKTHTHLKTPDSKCVSDRIHGQENLQDQGTIDDSENLGYEQAAVYSTLGILEHRYH
jgi:hypothetical protein